MSSPSPPNPRVRERALDLLEHNYNQRLMAIQSDEDRDPADSDQVPSMRLYAELGGQLREVERSELLRLQQQGEIGDNTLRKLERELDLLDLRWPSPDAFPNS